MTEPTTGDIARALHLFVRGDVNSSGTAVRPVCLCETRLPRVAVSIADGDAEAAAVLVHTMHVDDVLAELHGGRPFGARPSLDMFT